MSEALPHVVLRLLEKRKDILDQIDALQHQVRALVTNLDHVDATIRLFHPNVDYGPRHERRAPPPYVAFKGEVSRLVLGALREAQSPLSTKDIGVLIMRGRGLPADDLHALKIIQHRAGVLLARWKRRGLVRSLPGPRDMLSWEIDQNVAVSNIAGQ